MLDVVVLDANMSLWRRSNSSLAKPKKKGLSGLVLTVDENHEVFEDNRPKSSYKKLSRNASTATASIFLDDDTTPATYDVAIVGAGPAGLMLA